MDLKGIPETDHMTMFAGAEAKYTNCVKAIQFGLHEVIKS